MLRSNACECGVDPIGQAVRDGVGQHLCDLLKGQVQEPVGQAGEQITSNAWLMSPPSMAVTKTSIFQAASNGIGLSLAICSYLALILFISFSMSASG